MVLPRHPGNDDQVATPRARTTKLAIAAVGALIVAMVVLHLTGVIQH